MAVRRARIWLLPEGDLYRDTFVWAHQWPSSWAAKSYALLSKWGVDDWPLFAASGRGLESYRKYARSVLEQAKFGMWYQRARGHLQVPDYLSFQSSPSQLLKAAKAVGLPWETRIRTKSFCRLRAGMLTLSGVDGRPSVAKLQSCIFCGRAVRTPMTHVVATCPHWGQHRELVLGVLPLASTGVVDQYMLTRLLFVCPPSAPGFIELLQWFSKIDSACQDYWAARGFFS